MNRKQSKKITKCIQFRGNYYGLYMQVDKIFVKSKHKGYTHC